MGDERVVPGRAFLDRAVHFEHAGEVDLVRLPHDLDLLRRLDHADVPEDGLRVHDLALRIPLLLQVLRDARVVDADLGVPVALLDERLAERFETVHPVVLAALRVVVDEALLARMRLVARWKLEGELLAEGAQLGFPVGVEAVKSKLVVGDQEDRLLVLVGGVDGHVPQPPEPGVRVPARDVVKVRLRGRHERVQPVLLDLLLGAGLVHQWHGRRPLRSSGLAADFTVPLACASLAMPPPQVKPAPSFPADAGIQPSRRGAPCGRPSPPSPSPAGRGLG